MSDHHHPNCRWLRTIPAECEYRETHNYCPHPQHSCNCDELVAADAAGTSPAPHSYIEWLETKPDRERALNESYLRIRKENENLRQENARLLQTYTDEQNAHKLTAQALRREVRALDRIIEARAAVSRHFGSDPVPLDAVFNAIDEARKMRWSNAHG